MRRPTGYDDAIKAVVANRSARYNKLDALERYVATTQYEGRQNWFHAGEDAKPLIERAPCIAYPIIDAAITSNLDLLLGDGRRPEFDVSLPVESGSNPEPENEGSEDADEPIEDGIRDLVKQSRFWAAAREVFKEAQSCGTAVSIYGARNSKLFVDTVLAKWCEPKFDKEDQVSRIEIKYPYLDTKKDGQGNEIIEAMLYRRVIDETRDTTYLPAKADKDGREPNWIPDPERTFEHGLGHCPVVWYAHMKGCAAVNRIDGRAIHEKVLDEVFALDCSLSQRHRAALYAGDPQWTEIGVEIGGGPKANGRQAQPDPDRLLETAKGGAANRDNPVTGGHYNFAPQTPARKKGPGEVWQFDNPEVKVQMHTLPGDALKAIDDNASDLRTKIAESLCVVFLDPDSIKFAASLSGKAIMALKARQIDRVDQYREDFGDHWIVPQMLGLLKVVAAKVSKGEILRLRAADKLAAMMVQNGGLPDLDLRWGKYFKPSIEDMKALVELLKMAKEAGFATLRMVLEKLQDVFDIADIDKAMAELEEAQAEKEAKAREDRVAETKALHEIANGKAQGIDGAAPMEQGPRPGAQGNAQPGGQGQARGQANPPRNRGRRPRRY